MFLVLGVWLLRARCTSLDNKSLQSAAFVQQVDRTALGSASPALGAWVLLGLLYDS